MSIESIEGRNTPECIYFIEGEGRCVFRRGAATPSLSDLSETPGGRSTTLGSAGGFSLSGLRRVVLERLCRARLYFGNRGAYQKANCDEYATSEPEIKLIY